MRIIHLQHNQIDKEKWDATIANAANCRIYALSWYLDIVSPGWEALVTEDYRYVMPLPVKTRFGVAYLVQPVLCQQLGIFAASEISQVMADDFISNIPYKRYILQFNADNKIPSAVIRKNFTLALKPTYEQLRVSFSKNTIRNILKSEKKNLHISNNIKYRDLRQLMVSDSSHYPSRILGILEQIYNRTILDDRVEIRGAFRDKILISACLLLKYQSRYYYLAPVSSPLGKEDAAMFAILDSFIRENAGQSKVLDFEGSMIESVARFYTGFGAVSEDYFLLQKETLPGALLKYCKDALKL